MHSARKKIYCYIYIRTGYFVTVNISSCQPYNICSDTTINIGQRSLILVAFASETELSPENQRSGHKPYNN